MNNNNNNNNIILKNINQLNTLDIKFEINKQLYSCNCQLIEWELMNETQKKDIKLALVSKELIDISTEIAKASNTTATTTTATRTFWEIQTNKLTESEKIVDQIYEQAWKLKIEKGVAPSIFREQRKKEIESALKLKTMIVSLHKLIADGMKGTLKTGQLASITSMAYQNVRRKFAHKLDERATVNVSKLEALEKQIDKIVIEKSVEINEIDEQIIDKVPCCVLTLMNFKELIERGDCACIGLVVDRCEAAIVEPSLLHVKSITTTILSAEAFFDAYSFAMQKNVNNPENVHGAFDRNSLNCKVTVGSANEPINAILPLFLHPLHWEIAFRRMPSIMGWVVTLDPLGYATAQTLSVPFSTLFVALRNKLLSPSQWNSTVYNWILDTCLSIYDKFNVKDQILPQLISFIQSPEHRTKDVIIDLYIWSMYLLCAKHRNHLDSFLLSSFSSKLQCELELFIFYLIEEQLRRSFPKSLKDPYTQNPTQIFTNWLDVSLSAPVSQWVQPALDQWQNLNNPQNNSQQLSHYQILFESSLATTTSSTTSSTTTTTTTSSTNENTTTTNENTTTTNENTTTTNENTTNVSVISALADYSKEKIESKLNWSDIKQGDGWRSICEPMKNCYKRAVIPLLEVMKEIFGDQIVKINEQLIENGSAQIRAAILQIGTQFENSERRAAITNKTYCDPWDEQRAQNWIISKTAESISNQIRDAISTRAAQINSNKFSQMAQTFSQTDNLREAAGILQSSTLGAAMHLFISVLQDQQLPAKKPIEKLNMLTTNKYLTVKLLRDTQCWIPSRKNVHKFWLAHASLQTFEQWKQLFPTHEHPISVWYGLKDRNREEKK
eukprot:TRINITY_DN148_c0_g1_i2.p1 TRINITY_DN148_c0_g1~~TRINITY_DN148_c0_g1_i2.p1  ORF type:complete len:840 (-),score=393.93 TRINITY_DN148_c0_g1_i2:164-2683(-)